MARNEELIVANPELCGTPNDDYIGEIRSDFTICSNPEDSLGSCTEGSENEPEECGFGPNLLGLCGYCAASSPNSTDSCCSNSDATTRCSNVVLPTTPSTPPLFPSDTSTSSSTPAASNDGGLSGGQIAGIVVGSVAGAAVIGALIAFLIIFWRRRQRDDDTIFNQPSPQYRGGPASPASREKNESYDLARGGRVARMSALQSHPEDPPHASGAVAGKFNDSSDSEPYSSGTPGKSKRRPPVTTRRNGSLSSASVLAGDGDAMSPNSGSGGQYSSPEGVTSQSEQLPYFRDYYSEDDIHPNDKVAVLWAYQPRAGDEFELERGEMLKVVGIWDDGWATGVRLNERAEDYDGIYRPQRDSGVSNGSERRGSSPPPTGEIKAFPVCFCSLFFSLISTMIKVGFSFADSTFLQLVCVCVPEHWKKTIEADGYDGAGPGSPPT